MLQAGLLLEAACGPSYEKIAVFEELTELNSPDLALLIIKSTILGEGP